MQTKLRLRLPSGPKSGTHILNLRSADNFRKCTPILTIFSPLEQEICDA